MELFYSPNCKIIIHAVDKPVDIIDEFTRTPKTDN